MWFLGWMPRQFLKNLEKLKDKINEELFAESSDEEDNDEIVEHSDDHLEDFDDL